MSVETIELDLGLLGYIEADVLFAYFPAEKQTSLEPGCDAEYDIEEVSIRIGDEIVNIFPILNDESFKIIEKKLEELRNEY